MTVYANPGTLDAISTYKEQYENFIDGKRTPPVDGQYMDSSIPVTGEVFCRVSWPNEKDIELALNAAHRARDPWASVPAVEWALTLHRIAGRLGENFEKITVAETQENGKAIRETLTADIPLAIDHFHYFAGATRTQEGHISQIDDNTVAYHFHEPLGIVGQIIPQNSPLLMATWKIALALVAGNCIVLKSAEQTPVSILMLTEIIADLLPDGALNIVNGLGTKAGAVLTASDRVSKTVFIGSTAVGQMISKAVSDRIILIALELGGKSPSTFFPDVMDTDDAFREKRIGGLAMFALNQGEVCTYPSRTLVHEDIADEFLKLVVERVKQIKTGNPLNTSVQMDAQASQEQLDKISGYLEPGSKEGTEVLTGGNVAKFEGLEGGYYIEPTIFKGSNSMRLPREEVFDPVLVVTTFKTLDEALEIANNTIYGLGAGVRSCNQNNAYRIARGIQAGRMRVNSYRSCPARAAFGGYKQSSIGRENHLMMLEHYQEIKCMLVSHDKSPTGLS